MVRKDIKIQINTILWENTVKKIETDFGKKYTKTDCMLITQLSHQYRWHKCLISQAKLL